MILLVPTPRENMSELIDARRVVSSKLQAFRAETGGLTELFRGAEAELPYYPHCHFIVTTSLSTKAQ